MNELETTQIVVGLTSFLVAFIFFVSTFANGVIIFVFTKNKKLRNSSTIFIVNLAVVGLLQGAISFPLLQVEAIIGWRVVGQNYNACIGREFVNEFVTCSSLFALLLVAVNRYSVVLLKHKYSRYFSSKKAAILVIISWIISGLYGIATALLQMFSAKLQDFKCRSEELSYPKSMAALQFTVFGLPITLIFTISILLLIYFVQDRKSLPFSEKLFSENSVEHRVAPGKKRRLTKNIRVLVLTLVTFSSCYMMFFCFVVLAMFTGRFPRLAYVTSVSLMCFGCIVHPYLYGYLNKRLKRSLNRLIKRMCRIPLCRRNNREVLVSKVSSCSLTSSSMTTLNSMTEGSFIDNYELTRSKLSKLTLEN